MTLLDWAIVALIALSTLGGLFRGFLRSVCSFLGLVVGIVLAAWNYRALSARVAHFVADKALAEVIAFVLIAVGVMLLAGLVGSLLRKSAKAIGLGWADSLLGGVFGFFRGCLLASAGMMAVAAFLPSILLVSGSKLAPSCLAAAHDVAFLAPRDLRERVGAGARMIERRAQEMMRQQDGRQ